MYWRKQVKPLREKLTNVVCYKLLMYTFLYEALLHYELNYNKGYKLCDKPDYIVTPARDLTVLNMLMKIIIIIF